ncbi:MAG: nucleoside-diphosphate kinase [Deltaproteobacteria bacterium]|nr:MAG: nucleoside-diphosphate kinase [Deltaproteobacteria bacterium]
MTERTLAIIKPDGVRRNLIGTVLSAIERAELRIAAMKTIHLTKAQAETFYAVHRERPFFDDVTTFMSSGPVVVLVLEGEGAITRWRNLMGPTNPKDAPKGTIRGDHGTDIQHNVVHGSDAPETAATEVAFFFSGMEIVGG